MDNFSKMEKIMDNRIIKREKYIHNIENALNFVPIVIVIGARQVGKTTLMNSLSDEFYKQSIFFNGQNPEIAEIFQSYSAIINYLKI